MSDIDVDYSSLLASEICNQLRANDPHLLRQNSCFVTSSFTAEYFEAELIAVFQALKKNTSVKQIEFMIIERDNTKRSALVAAEYVESSKTLRTL
jgi:hypothetical protein